MSIFLSYLFLGISLAAPIGPINAAQIDEGIKNGFIHSWTVGLGAMIADIRLYVRRVYGCGSISRNSHCQNLSLAVWLFRSRLHWN